jgi:HEAT repeat protein
MSWNQRSLAAALLAGLLAISAWGAAAAEGAAADVRITPRGSDAWAAFAELERQGGAKVVMLGEAWPLLVPAELRFQAVDGRKLVESVAAARGLKAVWVQGGKGAVLHVGASDAEVEQVRKGLDSADADARREAAWRARWLRDARIVPPLVKVARGADGEAARQALAALRWATWEAVLLLDGSAAELLTTELASGDPEVRHAAASALGVVSGESALALMEKALADTDDTVRRATASAMGRAPESEKLLALFEKGMTKSETLPDRPLRKALLISLGNVDGEKSLALLGKYLASGNTYVVWEAYSALGRSGREKDLALIEEALARALQREEVRLGISSALSNNVSGEKALGLLEKALASPNAYLRGAAASGLARAGSGEKVLALLEKAFADQNGYVRIRAVPPLGAVGGERAVALLGKALGDADGAVRRAAISALGSAGGDGALGLLEKALADRDPGMRAAAVSALGNVGSERAVALLEKALADKEARVRSAAVAGLGCVGGERAGALLERMLADPDAELRAAAVAVLGRGGPVPEKTLASEDVSVRRGAVGALGGAGGLGRGAASALGNADRDKVVALLEKALGDKDTGVRTGAAFALGRAGGEQALAPLLKALADPEASVRRGAVYALGALGGEKALEALAKALADQDANVRSGVVVALGRLGGERALAALEKALADADAGVRRVAGYALAAASGPRRTPPGPPAAEPEVKPPPATTAGPGAAEWPVLYNLNHTSFSPSTKLKPPLRVKWATKVPGHFQNLGVVVAENRAVLQDAGAYAYCMDAETGEMLWRRWTGRGVSSPCIANGRVYVVTSSGMHCLDLKTGDQLWERRSGWVTARVKFSPQVCGGRVFYVSHIPNPDAVGSKAKVQAWDAATGEFLWDYTLTNATIFSGDGSNNTTLLVLGNTVFASTGEEWGGGRTVALDIHGNELWSTSRNHVSAYLGNMLSSPGQLWLLASTGTRILNPANGSLLFTFPGCDYSKAYAMMNGKYWMTGYAASPSGYNMATGAPILTARTFNKEGFGSGCNSPIAANGYIYSGFGQGNDRVKGGHKVYAWDEAGNPVWSFQVETNVCPPMAIAYDKLYCITGGDGLLFCFESAPSEARP